MAVELSKSRSDLGVLSKELVTRPELLYRWRKELEMKVETSCPGQGQSALYAGAGGDPPAKERAAGHAAGA